MIIRKVIPVAKAGNIVHKIYQTTMYTKLSISYILQNTYFRFEHPTTSKEQQQHQQLINNKP